MRSDDWRPVRKDVWMDQGKDRDPGDEDKWVERQVFGPSSMDPGDKWAAIDSMRNLRSFEPPSIHIDGEMPNQLEWMEAGYEPAGPRHPNSEKFHSFLKEAGDLHDIKQKDYGKGDDPFANVRSSSDWGMPGWVGAMVRLNDKVKRLQSLARTGNLSNEGAVDSFMDIAVYALIARVLFEEETAT